MATAPKKATTVEVETKETAPVEAVSDAVISREVKTNYAKEARALKKQPKRKVLGNVMYQPYLGKRFTFLLNGRPVSIKFDGTHQEYPESVADILERKLEAIARTNTSKDVNVEI